MSVVRFIPGKVYYCTTTRYASDRETLKQVKIYWLCVKRNDSTGYVSFSRIFKGEISKSRDSRKVDIGSDWETNEKYEKVKIGYGGEGAWRNWFRISATNVKE